MFQLRLPCAPQNNEVSRCFLQHLRQRPQRRRSFRDDGYRTLQGHEARPTSSEVSQADPLREITQGLNSLDHMRKSLRPTDSSADSSDTDPRLFQWSKPAVKGQAELLGIIYSAQWVIARRYWKAPGRSPRRRDPDRTRCKYSDNAALGGTTRSGAHD